MSDLTAIVVAFHNAELLDRCLSSLPRNLPVWVIDNSGDAEVERVAAVHGAQYVDTGSNLGFAAGVNTGLRSIRPGSDVLLLNPDAVLSGDALHALHSRLRAPGSERLAAVSPALAEPDGHVRQRVRWPLPTPERMWREATGLSRLLPPPDEYCIGAVLLLRAEAIADVGPFDDRFFLYAEEADWQRRALERGWHTAEMSDVRALHVGAGTSADKGRREILFHAGIETYMRKWYGRSGWASYRAAAALGAALRGALLPGPAGGAALARARLYLRGPRRTAELPPRGGSAGRRVTHVVVTDAFAGVERYVSEVAREQAARGADVTVIGGDPVQMARRLGRARHRRASTVPTALRQLLALGRQDVIHAHMTAAELVAVLAAPFHGGHIIATRHFAGARGSRPLSRILGRAIRARIDRQIAVSNFVAEAIGEPAVVVPNGIARQPDRSGPRDRVVLCLQRLEQEKATDLALRAWAASGLGDIGWELHVAGSGSLYEKLQALTHDLGITASVRWLGHVTDTHDRLRRAGLLFATAPAEPFGLSVGEAMALATPVLASDGGAHPELVGPDGWLFPVGDATVAAAKLRTMVALPPTDLTHYGFQLQARQQRLFSLDDHVSSLDSIYSKASRLKGIDR